MLYIDMTNIDTNLCTFCLFILFIKCYLTIYSFWQVKNPIVHCKYEKLTKEFGLFSYNALCLLFIFIFALVYFIAYHI
jgi:hypothetical protein